MKKLISYLILLLWLVKVAAQSSFPVQVTNQFNPVPDWAYATGQLNNIYLSQFVTRAQVEAAPNTSIGHIYALNFGFGPQPGKASVITGFTISSSRPVTLQIRYGVPTGPFVGINIPENVIVTVADSNPVYIPVNWIMRNGKSVFTNCLNFMADADTAAWIEITGNVYNITDDFYYASRKIGEWVGTSITNGSGPTSTGTMYHTLLRDTLRFLGASFRHELNGVSGSTTGQQLPLFQSGAYDRTSGGSPPDVLFIELGVNDASVATPSATYTARLRYFAERFLTNPENKKIMVVILGATPLENTTAYNNSVTLDAAAAALVTTLQGIYPNRVFFVPLSSSFDRLVAANYAATDTPGARIHPSDQGCRLIMTNGFAPWLATSQGQIFLTNLKR